MQFNVAIMTQGLTTTDSLTRSHITSDDTLFRSSLTAKCVLADENDVFVSSANFTEAGQERNIEVGLRLDNAWLARKLVEHFKKMAETGQFRRAI
jgi:phosphatidylserine/phosphatidylglycerophosphate/cardiolipin synthase-like enzyme